MSSLRDSDIVPESYQMRLMKWRDEFTRGYFEIGDIANEIVLMNLQNGMQIEHALIYSAVGRFCGKSGRTIREYAEVSAFFPEDIRDAYDVLPFSHFRFAKSRGKDWDKVLEFSLEHPEATEDRLIHEFVGVAASELAQVVPPMVAAQPLNPTVAATLNPGVAASVAASDVAAWLPGIYALANLVAQAETVLSWKLKVGTRQKLESAIFGLKDVLRELSECEKEFKFDYDTKEAAAYWSP